MSGRPPTWFLVCYDICGEGYAARLRKVYRCLRGHGEHIQYSIFRCSLTPMRLQQLMSELEAMVDSKKDQILFVPLGSAEDRKPWRAFTLGMALDDPERVVRIV